MLYRKLFYTPIVIIWILVGCNIKNQYIRPDCSTSSIDLSELNTEQCPWISAHRGGPASLYPENSLETLKFCADSIDHHLILEIDVRTSKDGELLLMHDRSVDRTTNGTGMVSDLTTVELQQLLLVDNDGKSTPYKIPKLSEVLEWLGQTSILVTLDVKRGSSYREVIEMVEAWDVKDQCFIITYSIDAAEAVQRIDPTMGISLSVRGPDELDRFSSSKLYNHNRIIAFTGTRASEESLYKTLDKKNVPSILGTIGNLDRQAEAKGNKIYDEWVSKGIDIIATDRAYQLADHWNY